ncbi:unnamed protein product [Brugia timori]|uniref:Translocase of outer membrane 7 kDa subunit homolog n=1 Tax=Brugia timori TaxID=42155 RepID=A0A0R3R2A4_9BILA|nr:unnamed protein product [Brugia timori]
MAMSDEELFVGDENDSNSKTPAHEADPHDAAMQQQVRFQGNVLHVFALKYLYTTWRVGIRLPILRIFTYFVIRNKSAYSGCKCA